MISAFTRTGLKVSFQRVSNPRQFALEVIELIEENQDFYEQKDWMRCFAAYAIWHMGAEQCKNFAVNGIVIDANGSRVFIGDAVAKVLGLGCDDRNDFFDRDLTLEELYENVLELPVR